MHHRFLTVTTMATLAACAASPLAAQEYILGSDLFPADSLTRDPFDPREDTLLTRDPIERPEQTAPKKKPILPRYSRADFFIIVAIYVAKNSHIIPARKRRKDE